MIVAVGWAIGAMVFFKIAMDASFSSDVSIVGALILGAMTGVTVFMGSAFYATKMGQHLARVMTGQTSSFLGMTLLIWLGITAVNIVLGKLLVFGFAKRLNRDLGNDVFYDFGRYNQDDSLTFMALVAAPVLLHYITVIIGVNGQAKAATERMDGPDMDRDGE